jgi:phosphoserine aminotransferase
MTSFYPGPSRLYDGVERYLRDAVAEGILSNNHRSDAFMALYKRTVGLLRQKLGVPASYSVFFVSSATECWEIIAQSLVKEKSYHVFNGAFGKKWFIYTQRLTPGASAHPFFPEVTLPVSGLSADAYDSICITHNETSNGTAVSEQLLRNVRKKYPNHLIAVDATSSLGGIYLNFMWADVWFASVQKCFGLPAGLGILICSPNALKRAEELGDRHRYNSLLTLHDHLKVWQTSYTPNVLGIYLLMRVLQSVKPIREVEKKLLKRYARWEAFMSKSSLPFRFHIANPEVRSSTVLTFHTTERIVKQLKAQTGKAGLLLGNGYGELKSCTFRVANFPALREVEITRLMQVLADH